MVHYIGNVPITTIQSLDISKSKSEEEVYLLEEDSNFIFSMEEEGFDFSIEATLLKKLHPQNEDIDTQKEEVFSLTSKDVSENYFEFDGVKYYLSVDDVSLGDSGDVDNLHEVTIQGTALPYPKTAFFSSFGEGYGYGNYGVGTYGN